MLKVEKQIEIILASKSPRRKELLSQIGVRYRCMVSEKEEVIETRVPSEAVMELSEQKANEVARQLLEERAGKTAQTEAIGQAEKEKQSELVEKMPSYLIIGADTVVSCDGNILGKPKDEAEAFRMLRTLSGRTHEVYTGVTVLFVPEREEKPIRKLQFAECTKVCVAALSDADIKWYIGTGEPADKAGAYGIQGQFGKFVLKIEGDYNNVVGLPVARLFQEVRSRWGLNMTDRMLEGPRDVKACIFDLDGTTLDTIESIGTTVNMVLAEFGLPAHDMEAYKTFAGDGQFELLKRSLTAAGDTALTHYEEAVLRYTELFKERCTYHVVPYDGIRELFEKLKCRGIKLCIFSNKRQENVEHLLDTLFGENYFSVVLGQRDDYQKKPSGEGLDIILKAADVSAENCMYFGDTNTDMQTGKNYGLYTVGVLWGFRQQQELIAAGADALVAAPSEIVGLIEGMSERNE